ncbi:MAG: chaperone NapD [Mariprofundales bacterium]|nr:chaperone NapD [Mariprofundales bacterium]
MRSVLVDREMAADREREGDAVGTIVGAVLQVKPGEESAVRERLRRYDEVEIHGEDEQSRWVVTIEAESNKQLLTLTEEIQQSHGVLSVTPVYHYCAESREIDEQGGWRWR